MKTKFKIILSFILLAVVLFAAIPKVYIHNLLGHSHGIIHSSSDEKVDELKDNQDCNFEKFDTPVYYSVFKFILDFLPLKQSKESAFLYNQQSVNYSHVTSYLLRGPPIA